MVARIRFSATWIVDARSGQIRRATGCSKFQEKLQEFQYVRNYNWFARPSIVNSQISAVGCWYVLAQCCQWKKRNNYNYTSYWCLCIIGRNPYTVDREIFAVKIFSSLVIATKIRHVKFWTRNAISIARVRQQQKLFNVKILQTKISRSTY